MRKHFLLLALMALLPLAGWAQTDLNSADVSATLGSTELTYLGKETGPAIQKITVNGTDYLGSAIEENFTIVYKKGGSAATVKNVGSYTFDVTAKSSDFSGTANNVATFSILPGRLHIEAENAEKEYGDADPTELGYSVVSGLVGDDDINNVVVNFTSPLPRAEGEDVDTYNYTSELAAASMNYTVIIDNTPTLTINKATLHATYDGGSYIIKNYGEANPTLDIAKITYTVADWKGAENTGTDEEKAAARALAVTGTLDYVQTKTNANANPNGDFLDGKSGYPLTITGLTSKNYEIEMAAGNTMKIKQIPFAATPDPVPDNGYFTYEKDGDSFTYNGETQNPTFTIKYKDAQGTTHTLVEGEDYELAYKKGGSVVTEHKNAADYTVTVKAITSGNYEGKAKDAFSFSIQKTNLYVTVKNASKVYDGSAFDFSSADFEYNGLVPSENNSTFISAITGVTAEYKTAPADDKAANSGLAVKAVIAPSSSLNTNYNATGLATGTYTITQRPVKISAIPTGITFGDSEPTWNTTSTYVEIEMKDGEGVADGEGAISADEATIRAALEVGLVEDDYSDAKEYKNAIEVKLAEGEALPNYEITFNKATYTIGGAVLTLIAKNILAEYGDGYTLSYLSDGAEPNGTVEYELYNDADEEVDMPQNVGIYTIKIKEKTAEYLPANYEDINYVPGTLTITQKTLTITPGALTLNVGATEANLNTYGSAVVDGGKTGDNIEYELKFNVVDETGSLYGEVDGDGKLTTTGDYSKGITVVLKAASEDNDNANYLLSATNPKAALKVIAADALILATNDNFLIDKINSANDDPKDVTFAGRTLKAGIWETLVLPFNTTVKAVSEAFGYAVVDRLNENKEDGNLHFELWLNDIPANTPFMVKIYGDAEDEDDVLDLSTVTFTGKTIVAPDAEKIDADGNPYIQDGSNNKLIGLYTSKTVGGDDIWALNKKDTWKELDSRTADLIATKAYLDLTANSGARMIYVQDADGSVSAINTISGEVTVKAAEGWYTINGVKLEAAPAQKGIYIHNGKKVVVK